MTILFIVSLACVIFFAAIVLLAIRLVFRMSHNKWKRDEAKQIEEIRRIDAAMKDKK